VMPTRATHPMNDPCFGLSRIGVARPLAGALT
jgi:hypothetical protein